MPRSPFPVEVAYNVLNAVSAQWRLEPYRWHRERDLQGEIGGRLTHVFSLQGLGMVRGECSWVADGYPREQSWCRVQYEPCITYEYEAGKTGRCYPDIVIWRDLNAGEQAPADQPLPILWACELKYGSQDDGTSDVQKLQRLIAQQKVEFGCAVTVRYERTRAGDVGITWRKERAPHLWVLDVTLPGKNPVAS